jgi:hypothetical protein
MGFHTAPVGTLILPTTPRVSISPAGALNAGSLNVSGVGAFTRISVVDGNEDINSHYRISSVAPPGTDNKGAILGYSNDRQIYGLVGFNNAYSFYGQGAIYTSGNITAFSDIRSKENISTIEDGLSKTLTLNGVLYTDKSTQQRRTGLIAQDVLAVLPEAVSTNADGYYSLAYGNLVGLLVQAIKELNAKVDSLSAKVETLSSGGSE